MPPSLRPLRRIRPVRSRDADQRERQAFIALVNRALRHVAVLASSRGVCALQAAHLAHLPVPDLDLIASACECSTCTRGRLH